MERPFRKIASIGTDRFPFVATKIVHGDVTAAGGTTVRAKQVKQNAEIERLHLELDSFNNRIIGLEKLHPESSKIEALKASALVLSRQIDELRCSNDDLTGLLAK
jgi:hypothetical protein